MFLESSRYYRLTRSDVILKDGRRVKVLKLRRLPEISGTPTTIKETDRLDIMAQRQYNNPTMFWHIADANTEVQANDLIKEAGRVVNVPEQ